MKHTISVLVENEFGVLARVAGLFSGRGFNIQSLTVAETLDPKISRMTLVSSGDDAALEQMVKQLDKLVNVIKVLDVTKERQISRTLALIKLEVDKKSRKELEDALKKTSGRILDEDKSLIIVEVHGEEADLAQAVEVLKPFHIVEFAQTGSIAMQKGKLD